MLEESGARRRPRACIARPMLDAIQEPLERLRPTSEAKARGAPLKTGADLDEPPERAAEETSIRLPNVAEACAGDRGLCQDVSNDLSDVPAEVDDDDLDEEAAARVYGRLAALREAIEAERTPLGWWLRARVGKRVAWRREIEDTQGTDVIAPEWDGRWDLG